MDSNKREFFFFVIIIDEVPFIYMVLIPFNKTEFDKTG